MYTGAVSLHLERVMGTSMQCPRCGRIHDRARECDKHQQRAHLAAAFEQSSVRAEEQAAINLSRFLVDREKRRQT